jgi:hypothetical protein
MHGEKSRRHQFVTDGCRGETIVSVYEVNYDDLPNYNGPRLNVELMRKQGSLTSADLTLEEARWMRDFCDEFIAAHGDA